MGPKPKSGFWFARSCLRFYMFVVRLSSWRKHAVIGTLMLACAGMTASRPVAAQEQRKAVLVLHPVRQEGPGAVAFDRVIKEGLAKGSARQLDYYSETLDFVRVTDPEYRAALAGYLRRKYAQRSFDVVVAITGQVLAFANEFRGDLFPGAPLVFYAADTPRPGPMSTGVVSRLDLKSTVDAALRLQPDVTQVVLVSGTSEFDKFYRELARSQLRQFAGRLDFTYLTDLSITELQQRVSTLPARTIIYFLTVEEDAAKSNFTQADSFALIAAAANRPIYVWLDLIFGRGSVGGSLLSIDVLGGEVANVALRVLRGESPEDIPVREINANRFVFDWRELRRFGISEARLPPGSMVQFRQATVWDRYKVYILGTATLLLLQSALIGGLLVQLAKRRRAELAVRGSEAALRVSYEQNQGLAGRLITAQEAERARIARDLHDDVSQHVAGMGIVLSGLKRNIAKIGSVPQIDETVTALQDRTSALANAIRNLSHELHPSVLEHAGLVATLQRHCAEVEQTHHITVTFSAEDGLDLLSADVALCLFRVAQEALNNALRHARARTIVVRLAVSGDDVELAVIDDGIGFAVSDRIGSGLGLRSVDERVRLTGGVVTIESRPGQGAQLRVRIPQVR